MIPKYIHYCWFGGKPLPEIAVKCIQSWKKFFPDYKIIEWNEDNFDLNSCDYCREAYEAKKWAFVSDYARFKILAEYGGIYFDTDVEVIKSFDDILQNGAFIGRERITNIYPVNAGLGLAAEAGMPILDEVLEDYAHSHFEMKEAGKMLTVVERVTGIMEKHGLTEQQPSFQSVEGMKVYPPEYFCPYDYNTGNLKITENTHSIHWYDASWLDEKMQKRRSVCVKIQKHIKGRPGEKIAKFYTSCSYYWEWISTGQFDIIKEKIKKKLKIGK